MEDLNMIAADCVVISCCCQCLVLQILVFILLKLPYRLLRKTKRYVKKKVRNQKKEGNAIARELSRYSIIDGVVKSGSGSFGIRFEGVSCEDCCFSCMERIENALEGMSGKGEFAFGSFWKGEDLEDNFPTFLVQNLECHDSQYNLVNSFTY